MIVDNLLLAFGGIVANKVRSFLTMLSIGIGVFAVITLMAVAAGAAQATTGQLSGLGSPKLISVYGGGGGVYFGDSGGQFVGGPDVGSGIDGGPDAFDLFDPKATPYAAPPPLPLSVEDVALLNDPAYAPHVAAAAGYFSDYGPVTADGGGSSEGQVYGTNAFYARVVGLAVTSGTFLTPADITNRSRAIVVSTTTVQTMGATIGSTVRFKNVDFEVIGTVDDEYPGNPSVYIPETTLQDISLGPQAGFQQLYVLADDERTVEVAAGEVRQVIRKAHLLGPTDAEDFSLYTRTAELKSVRAIGLILQVLAAAIASIALFVAGIGVSNIMLVTVTERTREIGIRKAIGAQRHHILTQFLLEATVLTFTGGLAGLLLGSLVGYIHISGFSPVVTPFSVILALSFSIVTGLFFGAYPANRAASLPPIQALRYE